MLVGLALRLTYLLGASPFVDEYSSLMAVKGILAHGIPLLPAGFFYGHDILFSYAATGASLFWPDDLVAVRAMSLLASLGTMVLAYAIGQRLFSWKAGLLSAAFLAISPPGVLWGARARGYALEQFLALAAFWLFYLGVERERPAWRRLGLLVLVIAVFVHPEAALLLAGLALAVLVLRGFRWWLHLDRILEFALAGVGVIGRYLLQNVVAGGNVGGFNTIADARPTFGFLANWGSGFKTLGSFLLETPMVPVTILALIAILAVVLRRLGGRQSYAVRFLTLTMAAILVQMALLIGGTWQSVRYLLFAFPLLFLLAGAGLEALDRWISPRLPRIATTLILAAVAIVALLPSVSGALDAANTREVAFDHAFDRVAEQWAPGDRLATSAPAAAWVSRGQVDYFALGQNYEEFVWQKDGLWYDKWVGSPLIRTAPELNTALDEAEASDQTLWFVTDETRLLRRYDADFVQTVWDRMDLVYANGRAMVFRSKPAPTYALEINAPRDETFGDQIALAGTAIGSIDQAGAARDGALVVEPGQSLPLQLTWQALSPLPQAYTLFVHLTDASGQGHGQVDGPPLEGHYPMYLWQPGIRYPDERTLDLPQVLAPGRYRLEIGFYPVGGGDRLPVTEGPGRLPGDTLILDYLTVSDEQEPATPAVPLDAELGDAIHLLGFSATPAAGAVHPGDELHMTLQWQASAPTDKAYTLFVHVVGPDGAVLAQHDGPPQGGFYPTAFWDPGQRLEDQISIVIPDDATPGSYQVLAGFYLLETGDRLAVTGDDAWGGDAVLLGTLEVER